MGGGRGGELQRRPNLVRWSIVGLEKKEEGLGVRSLISSK